MNSAISYLSAAQLHADAVRESCRNPPLRPVEPQPRHDIARPQQRLLLRVVLLARL